MWQAHRHGLSGCTLIGGAFLAFVCLSICQPALAESNVVLAWNDTLLQAVRNTRFAPMFTARALAIVHTSG